MSPDGTDIASIATALVALGCPGDAAAAMAAQLDKRARQLAVERGLAHGDALAHLLRLMAGGWAAQARGIRVDS
ncbi:MAG: hypothetical protein DVB31_03240 [Verrucomicrobia bacterium]|nr:MAG: hypothetical protein DVB31_03240 [Verrucomicrobiota bacterium]